MNLSLQLGRALFGVGFAVIAAAAAFAQQAMNDVDADASAPNVARNRLEIVTLPETKTEPHWVVTSVRVGMPEKAAPEHASQRVVVRAANNGRTHG